MENVLLAIASVIILALAVWLTLMTYPPVP